MLEQGKKYVKLHKMLEHGDSVVMGISGGVDSVAMLLLFVALREEYQLSLHGVHINHGIRAEAGEDADYVRALCKKYDVEYHLFEANIPAMAKEHRKTEEEMGRIFRYQCFGEVAKACQGKIAVAHHQGDQAETVLFHLVRGTDLKGLTGILPVSSYEGISVIRPLLSQKKESLMSYLQEHNISWKEDVTNEENVYARNKLRNQIIPQLTEVNENAVEHIAQLAEQMAGYSAYFDSLAKEYIRKNAVIDEETQGIELQRNDLQKEDLVVIKAVLYEAIARACGGKKDITKEHVESLAELLYMQSGKRIHLPNNVIAKVSYEIIEIGKCLQDREKDGTYDLWERKLVCPFGRDLPLVERIQLPSGDYILAEWIDLIKCSLSERKDLLNMGTNSKNNYTKYFDCVTIKDKLCLRFPRKEDYLIIHDAGQKKKLSRYFMDEKIPADKRGRWPVLAADQEVLWVLGKRRCENYKLQEHTKYILKVRYEGEKHEG